MVSLVSDEYRKLNEAMHAAVENYGAGGARWASIVELIGKSCNCASILDYGCGKQTLKAALPLLDIAGYDPAIPELAALPRSSDFVICTDVLEHIEPHLLKNVLSNLASVVGVVGMFVISTRPAKKTLADGRNAHLIQEPPEYWLSRLAERFHLKFFHYSERQAELFVIVTPKFQIRPRWYFVSCFKTRQLVAQYPALMSSLRTVWGLSFSGEQKK